MIELWHYRAGHGNENMAGLGRMTNVVRNVSNGGEMRHAVYFVGAKRSVAFSECVTPNWRAS